MQSLVSTKRMLDFFNAEELTEYVDKTEDTDGRNNLNDAIETIHLPYSKI